MAVTEKGSYILLNDGINSLPDDIYGRILSLLPIKDAIKTSFLSRDWRFRWRVIPDLAFDASLFSQTNSLKDYDYKVVNFVNLVLLSHSGLIKSFKFDLPLKKCSAMDIWMQILQKHEVEEIILKFSCQTKGEYVLHSSIFDCQTLSKLYFSNCMVEVPSACKTLESLYNLELHRISFRSSHDIERLVSSCPCLGYLSIGRCEGFTDLKISSKSLYDFRYAGRFTNIYFDTLELQYISIGFLESTESFDGVGNGKSCSFVDLFSGQRDLDELLLWDRSLKFLSTGNIPRQFPKPYELLNRIYISIDLECLRQTLSAFCLLRSCPILSTLSLYSLSSKPMTPVGDFWESEETASCELKQLKWFDFYQMTGTKLQMKFVEFILANAYVLEVANVCLDAGITKDFSKTTYIFRRLNSLKRASSHAVVKC